MKRRRRTEILINGSLALAEKMAKMIHEYYEVVVIQEPENGLVMMKVRETSKSPLCKGLMLRSHLRRLHRCESERASFYVDDEDLCHCLSGRNCREVMVSIVSSRARSFTTSATFNLERRGLFNPSWAAANPGSIEPGSTTALAAISLARLFIFVVLVIFVSF